MRGALALVAATGVAVLAFAGPAAAHTPAANDKPLAGKLILVDPGHQLGNSNPRFAKQMAQTFFNGAITKGCNTTGTATNDGYPESTFTWKVGTRLKALLEKEAEAKHELAKSQRSASIHKPAPDGCCSLA